VIRMNLLKDNESHQIFKVLDQERHSLSELGIKLEYDKITVSKYISQMKMAGIVRPSWEKGEDNRWREYWRTSNNEWARLIREILSSKQTVITGE
jgi:hypothetical protein